MSDASAKQVKQDRRYTREHEWAKLEGDEVLVGITAFAVDQLGDVTLVNWDVREGQRVEAGKVFGTIESVKTLSDLFAPVSGVVKRLNPALESSPELVNEDPWQKGWMLVVVPDELEAIDQLLDAAQYSAYVHELDH